MMSTGATLRAAMPTDSDALSALAHRSLQCNSYDPEAVTQFAMSNAVEITPDHIARQRFWVAEQNDLIVGCIALDPQNGRTGQICSFFVAPELSGMGIGKLLWFRLVPVAQAQGFTELCVVCDPTSVSFYETLGFVTKRLVPVPALEDCMANYMLFQL